MSQEVAFPYRTFPSDSYSFSDWFLRGESDEIQTIGVWLDHWDYNTDFRLKRNIALNRALALEVAGLEPDTEISLVIRAVTGPTSYRRTVNKIDIPLEPNFTSEINVDLNSSELRQQVTLLTDFVLNKEQPSDDGLVASRQGSKLAGDLRKIGLEGSNGRFPTQMVDFHQALPRLNAPHAMWHLEWDPSRPGASFLGSVQLFLNKSREELLQAVEDNNKLLLSTIRCDVIRHMIFCLLEDEGFLLDEIDFPEETVGAYAREWVSQIYGDMSLPAIKSQIWSDPSMFQTRLQSRFG